ncbi:DNA-directed RNA polymerases I and III subunit RPAC2-like [Sycon ciliatum]|uniref:DNA-directed RNA polymerases I and III subunit RPAC2-like n=1 Tax=Sycon ciliatum TaxID=27933 RepID=UPI0020AD4616|eukprot:scpid90146/ scgid22758/ DNA-directed RNA polymerases I and III subunit RPAC2; DNA-directed RNA polymerase I subunit D
MADEEQKVPKLEMLPLEGVEDETCSTFILNGEDHTLGNALRHIIMKDPSTSFCGYTVPHPAEHRIYLRIQTHGESASDVLKRGLTRLQSTCQHVMDKFDVSVTYFKDQQADAGMDTS